MCRRISDPASLGTGVREGSRSTDASAEGCKGVFIRNLPTIPANQSTNLLNWDVPIYGQNDLEHRRALLDLSFLPGRLCQSVDRVVYWRDECDIPKL
jgi:hypothetical protein